MLGIHPRTIRRKVRSNYISKIQYCELMYFTKLDPNSTRFAKFNFVSSSKILKLNLKGRYTNKFFFSIRITKVPIGRYPILDLSGSFFFRPFFPFKKCFFCLVVRGLYPFLVVRLKKTLIF